MGDAERTDAGQGGVLKETAKAIGTVAGKVANALGAGGSSETPANAKVYQAEYVGSGTFIISKPKRSGKKAHQARVKNPQRGSRK